MNLTVCRTSVGALALFLVIAHHAVLASERVGLNDEPLSVVANDNRQSAGILSDGLLTLKLRASVGIWRPEGAAGPGLRIEAFGEETGPLQAPAPLIRVPEGTEIAASIRNDLAVPLRVHGLCARDGAACGPLEVPPSGRREVRFKSGGAGTYHYWATTTGMPLPFRGAGDTQLSGAFIVDPAEGSEPDRVLVITEWTSLTNEQLRQLGAADDPGVAFFAINPKFTFLINGLSWPTTERLTYRLGERVRWRVVNLSTQWHPMHLHGFYFDVDSVGDGLRDQAFDDSHKQRVVTQLMRSGTTLRMTWTPERVGNWLFHCHIAYHVAPERRLASPLVSINGHADHAHHDGHDSSAGMAGMILGVTVVGPDGSSAPAVDAAPTPARALTLVMHAEPKRYGDRPAYGFALADETGASANTMSVPGPPLVLERGEPVEITLINRLPEATAIHWHGIELDSYYDGVHGWSGAGERVTPLIAPGATFTVRFTPPRAGTFMYHTHMHDQQLVSGMYGALIVLERGEIFDPALDHVLVIGKSGPAKDAPTVVNGARDPQFVWKAGARHRLRFINITADDVFVVSLGTPDAPATWRTLTKDAATVPVNQSAPRRATQTVSVGETFDMEYNAPPGRSGLWLEVRTPAGKWHAQSRVVLR